MTHPFFLSDDVNILQIRTSLKISTSLLIIVFFLLTALIVVLFQSVNAARIQRSTATQMLTDINNLRGLTLEYLLYPNPRGQEQLFFQIDALANRLNEIQSVDPKEEMLISELKKDAEQLKLLLSQLVGVSNGGETQSSESLELRNLLIGQITIISQRIIDGTVKLVRASELRTQNTLGVAYSAIIASSIIQISLVLFIIFFLFYRKIFKPLIRLERATKIVAEGNLDFQVPITNYNEVGRLSNSFNIMLGRIKELDEIKSRFLSTAAHQLRTPIAAIRWNAEIILANKKLSQKEQLNLMNDIHGSSIRMSGTIADLLNASRIEQGRLVEIKKIVSILKVVEAAIKDLGHEISRRKVDVIIDQSLNDLPELEVDQQKLFEIIINLISNGITYNHPGGKVNISANKKTDGIEIIVADTGIGIPQKDREKIFSKFYRTKNAIEKEPNGLGIGLFIAKSYLDKWGGKLEFSSEIGMGTTFRLMLPKTLEVRSRKV